MIYTEPVLPETVTDVWAADAMLVVKNAREDRGFTYRRFASMITREGYEIVPSEYKRIETFRGHSTDHIRAGLLTYAYRALNSTRTAVSEQTDATTRAMIQLASARLLLNLSYVDVADQLSRRGIFITASEYRAAEQGLSRTVSYDLVITAADILGVEL